jgi:hypothetical protein
MIHHGRVCLEMNNGLMIFLWTLSSLNIFRRCRVGSELISQAFGLSAFDVAVENATFEHPTLVMDVVQG